MKLRSRDLSKPEKKPEPELEKKPVNTAREVGVRVEGILAQIKKLIAETPRGAEPVPYEFEIVRDGQGFIKKILARPVTPTKH